MADCARYNPVSHHDEELRQQDFVGERALYRSTGLTIRDSVFRDGESPLKECHDIIVTDCEFQWKYPLWYSRNIRVSDSVWQEMARSGVWYTDDIVVEDSLISAPKNFRRCDGVKIDNVCMPKAQETLWSCRNVKLSRIDAQGDYFGMNSSNIEVDGLKLYGNYAFDGGRNIIVRDSKLLSKDCFWNCEDVELEHCYISGEYLAWNTRHLCMKDCIIQSDQGLCYIDDLRMEDCRTINTTLAFEKCTGIEADIISEIDSVLNPGSGRIRSRGIRKLIVEPDNCDISRTSIETRDERWRTISTPGSIGAAHGPINGMWRRASSPCPSPTWIGVSLRR